MLTLENITNVDGIITMDVYVEGNKDDHFTMSIDAATMQIIHCSRENAIICPAHARQYIKNKLKSKSITHHLAAKRLEVGA